MSMTLLGEDGGGTSNQLSVSMSNQKRQTSPGATNPRNLAAYPEMIIMVTTLGEDAQKKKVPFNPVYGDMYVENTTFSK